jgi:uncharacterized membrane protein YecN with MAPEG domain
MYELQITLISAAVAALINLWLAFRCGSVRGKEKIMHGDGGNPMLMRRMRAQANFVEYTPFALILVGVLEASGFGGWPLALAAGLFLLGRVLHGIGMDREGPAKPRMIGMLLTLPILIGLAVTALLAALDFI